MLIFKINLCSQININVDEKCAMNNCALLGSIIYERLGKKILTEWLEHDFSFGLVCDVDSLGHVIRINSLVPRTSINIIGVKKLRKLEKFLIRHKIVFYFCVSEAELPKSEQVRIYREYLRDYFQKNKTIKLNVATFPYVFMNGYDMTLGIPKTEYYLKKIRPYL